jgi:SAM-dependent methyltransferase
VLRPGLRLVARALAAADFAPVRARIREAMGRPGLRTLDVGCGPGLFADVFAGEDYVGLDRSHRNVAWARRARPGAFLVGDPRQVDLPAGRFDQALAFALVETLSDADVSSLLQELRRLLVPGGLALVITEVPSEEGRGRLRPFLPGPKPPRALDSLPRLLGTTVETFESGLLRFAEARVRWD